MFDNANTNSGVGFTVEQISSTVFEAMPATSEIVDYGNNVSALDFGNHPLVRVGLTTLHFARQNQ